MTVKIPAHITLVRKFRHITALFGRHLSHIPLYTIIEAYRVPPTKAAGQPHKKYPSWNKNSLMDIFKWFLQFSEKSIPAHTLNDRYTAYSFFYKSFSSFYQIVYPISLGYNKSF